MQRHLTVFLEARFRCHTDGGFSSDTFNDTFWQRYLVVFDAVTVVARVDPELIPADTVPKHEHITDPRVRIDPMPYYLGLAQFVWVLVPTFVHLWRAISNNGAYVLRMPGLLGSCAMCVLRLRRKPYAIELVGDIEQVLASMSQRPWSRYFPYWAASINRAACNHAVAVSYVTRAALQQKYPASNQAYVDVYHCLDMPEHYVLRSKRIREYQHADHFILIAVGSMAQRYKGFDVLLEALALLVPSLPGLRVWLVGDGVYRASLEQQVASLSLQQHVVFHGAVTRQRVFKLLDQADVFVMPSRTEGLPRALIEAFARGLPAVGSRVGGIPELLAERYLFNSEDAAGLAALLKRTVADVNERWQMSEENLTVAQEYTRERLTQRRTNFYKVLAGHG